MLTVLALPAACRPLKIRSTAKLGEKLSAMFDIIYTKKEYMYIGRRPMVSDSDPQNSGEMPWMIR